MAINNKQTILKSLDTDGWHLSNEFLDDLLNEKPNVNINDVKTHALNADFKIIGKKTLPEGIMNGKLDTFEGPCVLQIVRVKNISAPKDNETSQTAPPLYKITLTDGIVNCNALAMEDIANLNLNTPPGTKVLLKGSVKTKTSSLILLNKCVEVLGGRVESLYQKWLQNKELSAHIRNGTKSELGEPPAWIPFGTGSVQQNQVDTSRKTLVTTQECDNMQEDTTSEFSQARQAALAEAIQDKLKINKTFISQTVHAPPSTTSTTQNTFIKNDSFASSSSTSRRPNTGPRRNNEDGNVPASKPQTLTLFDMLKPKLNIKEEPKKLDDEYEQSYGVEASYSTSKSDRKLPPRFQRETQKSFISNGKKQSTTTTPAVPTFDSDDFAYDLNANKVTIPESTFKTKVNEEIQLEENYDNNNNNKRYSKYQQQQPQMQQLPQNGKKFTNGNSYYQKKNYQMNNNYNVPPPYINSYTGLPPMVPPQIFYDQTQLPYTTQPSPYVPQYDPYYAQHPPPPPPPPSLLPSYHMQPPIIPQEFKSNESNQTLGQSQQQPQQAKVYWKVGDKCMAKYIFDNRFYPAIIQNIQRGSVFVTYIGYDDIAELRFTDLKQYKEPSANVLNANNSNINAVKA